MRMKGGAEFSWRGAAVLFSQRTHVVGREAGPTLAV